ncbi:MAG: DUF1573 domain-containing protein [Melioribacteraceae bacterium]|nr:DUF1573 domain-containing protein [Melioribacteraceae bacterium]
MIKKITLLFLFAAISCFGQSGTPKIVIAENEFDFGDIKEGVIVEHDFIIKNEGDSKLTITRVRASCGCTAASPNKNVLEPGESTSVKVEFNSARRNGAQTKHVYVSSDDPNNPKERITFTAYILSGQAAKGLDENIPRLRLMENKHNLGVVAKNSVTEWKGEIKNVGKKVLVINEIKSMCSCITAYISNKRLEPGETAEFTLEFRPEDRVGSLSRTLEFYSNDPIESKQVLTLFVYIPTPKED